jgi:transposase
VKNSLPAPDLLVLDTVTETETGVIVSVRGIGTPCCPVCFGSQVSYHSAYKRKLLDLPWQGRPVHLCLRTRRFRCRNASCPRKIFAERIAGVGLPRARETTRLSEIVGVLGYALGGLPGARILRRLGMARSRDTVLRRIKRRRSAASLSTVRVLGVDDWAWRKRQNYGTLLMDLEQGQVIDLLPERSAESFAHWLKSHPQVAIITRDRSGLYADGGRQGAPDAAQVTDRYHLVSNLAEAVERDVQQLQAKARAELAEEAKRTANKKLTRIEARRQRCRQARYERYTAVMELHQQGLTQLAIAEKVGVGPDTIARWVAAGSFPERRIRRDRRRDRALFQTAELCGCGSKLGDDNQLSELDAGSDDVLSEVCQVVLVGAAYAFDESMNT